MRLRGGQVFITEGKRNSLISQAIAWATRSWYTHTFIVLDGVTGIEASWPRVRKFNLKRRIEKLKKQQRAFVVLELPTTEQKRQEIVRAAESYVGRKYDLTQVVWYLLTGRFQDDGPKQVVCSRLVTAAFKDAGINLFPTDVVKTHRGDRKNLQKGAATPSDLLHSLLVPTMVFDGKSLFRVYADIT